MEIGVGDSVEICSTEEGLLGSYFLAKVIRKVVIKNKKYEFLVEYKTLLDDKDEMKALREIVEVYKVRPVPPIIRVPEFDVLDKVDAYDNDGWWVGRVTGRFDYTYTVYFDSTGDEWSYNYDKLRLHQDYCNGVWIIASSNCF